VASVFIWFAVMQYFFAFASSSLVVSTCAAGTVALTWSLISVKTMPSAVFSSLALAFVAKVLAWMPGFAASASHVPR
jgi:hypothetical protein